MLFENREEFDIPVFFLKKSRSQKFHRMYCPAFPTTLFKLCAKIILNMSDKLECRRPTGDTMTPLSQFYQSMEMSHYSLVTNTADIF